MFGDVQFGALIFGIALIFMAKYLLKGAGLGSPGGGGGGAGRDRGRM